jgi:5-deoxy-glucuronate isomerase
MQSGSSRILLITPDFSGPEYVRVTPRDAGWDLIHFAARRMTRSQRWEHAVGAGDELALVVLGGVCRVSSSRGEWASIGRRPNVFAGMPHCLYLPRNTDFAVEALSDDLDIAYAWCRSDGDHPAKLVTPADVTVEIRGGGNASRQINSMLPPGFPCSRLVVVEVYTPSGNWSSYPPHKHDVHRTDADGRVIEADLEERYFYKLDRPSGYAYQRVYTDDRSLDELVLARDSHVVLVPEGYHPVVSAHGYTSYYLNVLAGSAQSLAATDDPDHAWIKGTWTDVDPRLPIVHHGMEETDA